jgi:hypothetical protein
MLDYRQLSKTTLKEGSICFTGNCQIEQAIAHRAPKIIKLS